MGKEINCTGESGSDIGTRDDSRKRQDEASMPRKMHTTLIGNSCGTQREKGEREGGRDKGGREGEREKEILRQREREREREGGREREYCGKGD